MITPELIGYIRGEFAKGKTREEIRTTLATDSGWGEEDLNEAFRTVIPMQGFKDSSVAVAKTKSIWIILIVVAVFCAVAFFMYRPVIVGFWNSSLKSLSNITSSFKMPSFGLGSIMGTDKTPEVNTTVPPNNPPVKKPNTVRNCGVGVAPDLKNPTTYENDAVLSCLGNSALVCEDAKAILKDPLFPTIFQVIKDKNNEQVCNFKLSYADDSTLVDATGEHLRGQYITCPISIVKALDETKKPPLFNTPNMDNAAKYGSQIYFYGVLGLFIENNVEKTKILNAGCSGSFIDSIVASYNKMQSKNQ
ncbi:hypothetical protein A2W67_00050 [Candidatus Nomurabacteria bacterium RIFCSPLOWO2_02_40_28]|uniref:Uncharacterized protein n=2 Tax=Candidatus Nomuraibacteriota TaxID=1752729 RepID=A0A837HUY2_9BACT|nr:MAG: hypothetical protein UT27_C0014G0006 [Candidatus Nomurabacteria bacterium GW2011_GWD2_39_12]KKR19999.1 MAG: hypothetical protein UT51_C0010G0008 [Candidatus Nomurabacteria bacterium GW2011_GWC2_39_41]KKR36274.1 MAG: hypothetical protein UT70_C0018G0006 [Candidatus Nomurabacteria bacterium GW2011_GWE2_40_10]KKR37965.1 MAG: hypothetical protein UT73_C0009G0008 [Candidatus Nomurabacteria bacterium GW2011_GWB1_40_11]KKR39362.1 MAG: hypothetical protein UT74_C0013G0008 [Parcubacteria group b